MMTRFGISKLMNSGTKKKDRENYFLSISKAESQEKQKSKENPSKIYVLDGKPVFSIVFLAIFLGNELSQDSPKL